ncbi:hypothetical protein N7539_000519 [Penicillium diatomitis]|uniref:SNF2 family helicase n=1 Tax=Penicillium diatomitis TaxID=2819901 RepID=A0A9W9XM35_9EURO|nr:uncharacterized protein N7539_000519 [Penicillium diatomitis]KAJ5495403.1 hypothetical protein N7539_000519 [Penicillium diatomitis]
MPRAAAKRKAEAVESDTNGHAPEDNRGPKTSRTDETNGSSIITGQRFGQAADYIPLENADYIPLTQVPGADEDDAHAEDLVESTQGTDESSESGSILYGKIDGKIVGVRFYRGVATPGEHVVLRREPHNQYDRNAIRVDNVMGAQIGHIPRGMAAKLAPYMDARDLSVEGILTGYKGQFDCPVLLRLFGTNDPARRDDLKHRMQNDKLPVKDFNEAQREQKKQETRREQEIKQSEKNARAMALGKAAQQWQPNANAAFANLSTPTGLGEPQSIEELLDQSTSYNPRDISKVVESFGQKEADLEHMPMAPCPSGLSTELLPYQRQGLAWMINKESPSLPAPGSDAIVQLWKRDGSRFTNVATNYSTDKEPPLASGGILADDMGLGKTIQIISLIMANSTPKTPTSSKTTLILAPVGVMSNWRNQIEDHTHKESAPKVLIYHGSGKKEKAKLADYDVVISSYGALAMEYEPNAKKPSKTGIFSLQWRRVVLDEGHTIRNPRSKGALAATAVRADSRWTLTGTPIINTLKDLYSQVRFLHMSGGMEDLSVFNSILIRPLANQDSEARLLLEALMSTICLRRRKDMQFINLRLPEMTSRVLRVKFHPHELEKYNAFQKEAKGALLDFKDKEGGYSTLLEVILRLRQVCNHWALCKKRIDKLMGDLEKWKVVPLTPENLKALQDMLQIQIESQEACAVCLDNLEDPVITSCGHAFCRGCIEQVIERQHKCPLCRADIKDSTGLVSPAVEMGEDAETGVADPEHPSSKIEALIKVLTAQGQSSGTKTVLFSQWTSFLDLIEPHLQQHGISFVRIDGKMPSVKRDNSINAFTHDPKYTVLLASLSVCSVGLNLVAANQVILADSWWAPAIEDQAVDRVYRLGQKRETTVWRLVMENSIEERVLDIQDRKRKLMLSAFRETAKKKAESTATRIADFETLLS